MLMCLSLRENILFILVKHKGDLQDNETIERRLGRCVLLKEFNKNKLPFMIP